MIGPQKSNITRRRGDAEKVILNPHEVLPKPLSFKFRELYYDRIAVRDGAIPSASPRLRVNKNIQALSS
jgi:hypothetical protein